MRGSISIFFYQVKQYHLYRQKKNMKIAQAKKLTKINTKSKNIILFSFHRGDTKSYSRLKNKHKYQQRSQKTMSLLKNRSDRWKQLFSHRLREVIIFH